MKFEIKQQKDNEEWRLYYKDYLLRVDRTRVERGDRNWEVLAS